MWSNWGAQRMASCKQKAESELKAGIHATQNVHWFSTQLKQKAESELKVTCTALEQVGNFLFVRRRCTVNTYASVVARAAQFHFSTFLVVLSGRMFETSFHTFCI
jgi:DNA-directed RNA polymerase specialized sigma54-like protein